MGRTWTEVAANHVDETDVVAVAGGSRAAALAADYGAAAEASPDALLRRTDIDLVVVTTQPDSHAEYVVAAAKAGKHILVEKPMARNVAECQAMADAAAAAGVRLAVCSQHRFRASPRAALDLIARGEIGDVRMVRAQGVITQTEEVPPDNEPYDDMGFHVCDLLRAIVGSPATLAFGLQASFKPTPPARQSTMALYEFESGAMAQVWITYELPEPGLGSMMQYLITGSKRMIRLDSYGKVELGDEAGWKVAFEQPAFDPNNVNDPIRLRAYADELRDVVGAIRERREPLVNGRWGRDTMAMLDAVRLSADRGEAVRLPLWRGAGAPAGPVPPRLPREPAHGEPRRAIREAGACTDRGPGSWPGRRSGQRPRRRPSRTSGTRGEPPGRPARAGGSRRRTGRIPVWKKPDPSSEKTSWSGPSPRSAQSPRIPTFSSRPSIWAASIASIEPRATRPSASCASSSSQSSRTK